MNTTHWTGFLSPRYEGAADRLERATCDGWTVWIEKADGGYRVSCDSPMARGAMVSESVVNASILADEVAGHCGGWADEQEDAA